MGVSTVILSRLSTRFAFSHPLRSEQAIRGFWSDDSDAGLFDNHRHGFWFNHPCTSRPGLRGGQATGDRPVVYSPDFSFRRSLLLGVALVLAIISLMRSVQLPRQGNLLSAPWQGSPQGKACLQKIGDDAVGHEAAFASQPKVAFRLFEEAVFKVMPDGNPGQVFQTVSRPGFKIGPRNSFDHS
jgi:hypothetical protein